MRYSKLISACFVALGAFTVPFLTSCEDEVAEVSPVDLRYDAEDSYTIEATNPKPISFVVKSTDTWEVESYHKDWCLITPNTGSPGQKDTVVVTYEDNENLDDRIDTLVIKSSYWTGKWVQVYQKGTAYLSVDTDRVEVDKLENEGKFNVLTNQKWSIVVKQGEQWLSVDKESGELDTEVSYNVTENKGEKREGLLVVLDRYGVARDSIQVIQDGVQLDPEMMEVRTFYNNNRVVIKVVSNATWTIEKDDVNAEWYQFETNEFVGDGTIVITLDENTSANLRQTTFTLKTEFVEGVEQVERQVTLKQAYNCIPVKYMFDELEKGKWSLDIGSPVFSPTGATFDAARVTRDNMAAGNYTFYIKSMSHDAFSTIYFTYGAHELRWHLDALNKETVTSTTPWTEHPVVSFDPSQPNKIELRMSDAEDGYTRIEWWLNDQEIITLNSTKEKLPNITWLANAFVYLGCSQGTVVYEWYEYTRPIIWE